MCKRLISLVIFILVVSLVSNAWADLVYRFEFEGDATESQNGYDGTAVGTVSYAAPVAGPVLTLINHGDALTLDYADKAYISAPATGWDIGPEITISYYAKQTTYGPGTGVGVAQARDYEDPSGVQRGTSISTWMQGVYFDVQSGGDRVWTEPSYVDEWYHYAFTHNTMTGSEKAYLNGVLVMDHTGINPETSLPWVKMTTDGADILYIGHFLGYWDGAVAWDLYFGGQIDDFRIYNEELDATAIGLLAADIVPEPATIMLLGLGGLGLLRKRK